MGWWGTEIMAGDTPLDWQGKLHDILADGREPSCYHFEMDADEYYGYYITSGWCMAHIRRKLMDWNDEVHARLDKRYDENDIVALQVMGWWVLETNRPARSSSDSSVRDYKKILLRAKVATEWEVENLATSGWDDRSERERHLMHFIRCCDAGLKREQYDLSAGEDDGLLASIAEALEN